MGWVGFVLTVLNTTIHLSGLFDTLSADFFSFSIYPFSTHLLVGWVCVLAEMECSFPIFPLCFIIAMV